MLIYRRQIKDLIRYENQGNTMVSLYLNVTPPLDISSEWNARARQARREIAHRFDKTALSKLDRLFDRIAEFVIHELKRPQNTRVVAIFADTAGFWQEYHLPIGLPTRIVVGPNPFVRPLSVLMDEFERFLVLIADSRHARIFSLYLGDFEEHPDVFLTHEEVPDRVRINLAMTAGSGAYSSIGVRGGTGDDQVASHVEDHIYRHMKEVARITFDFFKEKRFTRLIIGTPDDKTRPMLKDTLHSYLSQVLAGEFNAQPDNRDEDLRLLALAAAEKYERKRESETIDTLFEKAGPQRGLGVLGIEVVIDALRLGQAHTLVIRGDFRKPGYECPADHILSSFENICPLCGGEMNQVDDLVDEMVEAAISQDTEVEYIFGQHEEFDKYGIGAILRFTLG